MENRLKERFNFMVKCSMKTQQRATNGFKVLMESEAVAQVQAV